MTTLNLQVTSNANDIAWRGNGTTWTSTAMYAGMNSGYYMSNANRFLNVTIPQGSTINTATLSLYKWNQASSNANTIVRGHDDDNSPTLPTTAAGLQALTRTTANVAWNITVSNNLWTSPADISAVVQEIVDRSGWSSGNSMTIFVDGNETTNDLAYFYTYAQSSTYGAKLDITYTTYTEYTKTYTADALLRPTCAVHNTSFYTRDPIVATTDDIQWDDYDDIKTYIDAIYTAETLTYPGCSGAGWDDLVGVTVGSEVLASHSLELRDRIEFIWAEIACTSANGFDNTTHYVTHDTQYDVTHDSSNNATHDDGYDASFYHTDNSDDELVFDPGCTTDHTSADSGHDVTHDTSYDVTAYTTALDPHYITNYTTDDDSHRGTHDKTIYNGDDTSYNGTNNGTYKSTHDNGMV